MNLGFDIDGVISDFVNSLNSLVEHKYGIRLNEADLYCHDLNLVLGITKKERNQLVTENLKRDLAVNRGAKETLEKLFSEGHKIYLLTARFWRFGRSYEGLVEEKGYSVHQIVSVDPGREKPRRR